MHELRTLINGWNVLNHWNQRLASPIAPALHSSEYPIKMFIESSVLPWMINGDLWWWFINSLLSIARCVWFDDELVNCPFVWIASCIADTRTAARRCAVGDVCSDYTKWRTLDRTVRIDRRPAPSHALHVYVSACRSSLWTSSRTRRHRTRTASQMCALCGADRGLSSDRIASRTDCKQCRRGNKSNGIDSCMISHISCTQSRSLCRIWFHQFVALFQLEFQSCFENLCTCCFRVLPSCCATNFWYPWSSRIRFTFLSVKLKVSLLELSSVIFKNSKVFIRKILKK